MPKSKRTFEFEREDLFKIRFMIVTMLFDPEDAEEIESVRGASFQEYCDILVAVDTALYPPNKERFTLELSILQWGDLYSLINLNVNGQGMWKKYKSVCSYSDDEIKAFENRVFFHIMDTS